MSEQRFTGKTIIVTGAGSGIGKATAVRIVQEGGLVVASDVDKDRLTELASQLGEGAVLTVAGDVRDKDVISAIIRAAGPRIDGLANVAGIMDGFLPNAEVDDETWDRVISINVTAVMKLSRAVLPLMLEAGSGSIVNVSSEAALHASAAGVSYTASKHAVIGITKSNAVFYTSKGIRTNAVLPGPVATNIEAPFKSAYAGEKLGPIMQTTIPAPATPDQLAAAITWLLSDDSANVSGAVLTSDNGWSAI